MSPWLRSWALQEKDRMDSGYYGKPKRPHSTMMTVWLMVLIAAVGAIVMDMFRPEPPAVEMTAGVDRADVVSRWDGASDLGWWSARELFILRESKPGTSARHLDAIYMAERR